MTDAWTTTGELSDEAIDAIAGLLIEMAEQDHHDKEGTQDDHGTI